MLEVHAHLAQDVQQSPPARRLHARDIFTIDRLYFSIRVCKQFYVVAALAATNCALAPSPNLEDFALKPILGLHCTRPVSTLEPAQ